MPAYRSESARAPGKGLMNESGDAHTSNCCVKARGDNGGAAAHARGDSVGMELFK